MQRARIVGTGSYLPERILTNRDLESMVETNDAWIVERSGIRERRIAAPGQNASDLALEASKRALKAAGLRARDLDLIIVATFSGDQPFPSTGCVLQDKLRARNAVGFDLNATCSGFVYALATADAFIKRGSHKRVLVVGAELLSRFVDWQDRGTCILFGDGSGAVVMVPTDEDRGLVSADIGSDGRLGDILNLPGGGSSYPASPETLDKRLHFIKMKGNDVFKIAVKTMERISEETLKKNGLNPSDVSLVIPHQANIRIIQAVAKRLKLPMERFFVNVDRYGNTSAATIPIALDEALAAGRIKDGDYVLMAAFGGGLTWGSALIKW